MFYGKSALLGMECINAFKGFPFRAIVEKPFSLEQKNFFRPPKVLVLCILCCLLPLHKGVLTVESDEWMKKIF